MNLIDKIADDMSYTTKLQESKDKVYRASIVTKILDLMEKLRMDATDTCNVENTTLEYPTSELCIEDGQTSPKQLTLGAILKTNKIDRLKV